MLLTAVVAAAAAAAVVAAAAAGVTATVAGKNFEEFHLMPKPRPTEPHSKIIT